MKEAQREEYPTALSNLYKKMKPKEASETPPEKVMVKEIEELCIV